MQLREVSLKTTELFPYKEINKKKLSFLLVRQIASLEISTGHVFGEIAALEADCQVM